MTSFTTIQTHDGTVIVRDCATGVTARAPSLPEALAELRRLLNEKAAA